MTFTQGGSFGGGRVQTRSGRGGTFGAPTGPVIVGGGGGGMGRGPMIGGGVGLALVVALLGMFFGGRGGDTSEIVQQVLEPVLTGGGIAPAAQETGYVGVCSADQANSDPNCQLSATADSLDTFWNATLANEAGIRYTQPDVVSFSGSTSTACGPAQTAAGPFYCPGDQTVYVDTAFYRDLVTKFGGSEGPLAREYILAHEFGHHIQHQLGEFKGDRSATGAESNSVRIELQADCFAGIWAKAASHTIDPDTGVVFLQPLTEGDIRDAITAAGSVGDDHIQEMTSGSVNPDSFTHGSSAQRVHWFMQGYQNGTIASCDTFNTATL